MAKVSESPQAKFKRLADRRLAQAMYYMKLLANLSRPTYKGTQEDKDHIIENLRRALNTLEYLYAGEKIKDSFSIIGRASHGEDSVEL